MPQPRALPLDADQGVPVPGGVARVLSATSASARITLSGVRSSCEASAVNSSWRRRDRSTGASARWPTARQPKNMASRTNGPARTSAYSSRRLVCATPARLWPATSQLAPSRVIFSRNGSAWPALTVTASPPRGCWPPSGRAGNAGAPGLRAVTAGRASSSQKKTGAEPASPSPAPRNVRGALADHIRVIAGRGQAVGKPVVVLLSQPGGDHQVEHDDA